jgi:hypothetical protein
MAGAGYKLFNTGDVLTAAQVNTYLMEQTVMVFADAAARTTALSGVVSEGMISYLKDTNAVEVYDGSNWVSSDDPNAIQNTIVDAKGDLITATAADTPARLAVGSNGDTLVADSAASTGLRWQGNYAAGKNKIINGDFSIWQRGTSFTYTGATNHTADRFTVASGAGGTVTVSQQTFTPGTAPVAGYEGQFYLRADYTTSGTSVSDNGQKIEDVRTFAGQTVTVSIWAKVSTGTHTVTPQAVQRFGTGGSSAVSTSGANWVLTTDWQRFSSTITVPSVAGKTIGAGSSLQFRFDCGTSGVKSFDFWGFQAEAGSVATAFQTATGTLQGETALCQRYYWRQNANVVGDRFGIGHNETTTTSSISTVFPVTMRTNPTALETTGTATDYGLRSGGVTTTASAVPSLGGATNYIGNWTITVASGLNVGYGSFARASNGNAYIGWSAEL